MNEIERGDIVAKVAQPVSSGRTACTKQWNSVLLIPWGKNFVGGVAVYLYGH